MLPKPHRNDIFIVKDSFVAYSTVRISHKRGFEMFLLVFIFRLAQQVY